MTLNPAEKQPASDETISDEELRHKFANAAPPSDVRHWDDLSGLVPDTAADLLEPAPKSNKNALIKVGAGLTALAAAAGGYFALGNSSDKTPTPKNTSSAAPAVPGETAQPTESEPTAEVTSVTSSANETTSSTPETNESPEMVGFIDVANLRPEAAKKAKELQGAAVTDNVWEVKMDEVAKDDPSLSYAQLQFVVRASMFNLGQTKAGYEDFQDNSAGYAANEFGRFVYDKYFLPAYESSSTRFGMTPSAELRAAVETLAGRWVIQSQLKDVGTAGDGTSAPEYQRIISFDSDSFKTTKEGDGVNTSFSNSYKMSINEPVDMSKWMVEVLGLPPEMGTPKSATNTVENIDVLARPDGVMLEANVGKS